MKDKMKVVDGGAGGEGGTTEPTAESLKELVAKDKEARRQRAIAGIQAILERERCTMVPVAIITAGNVTTRVEITTVD